MEPAGEAGEPVDNIRVSEGGACEKRGCACCGGRAAVKGRVRKDCASLGENEGESGPVLGKGGNKEGPVLGKRVGDKEGESGPVLGKRGYIESEWSIVKGREGGDCTCFGDKEGDSSPLLGKGGKGESPC